MKIKTLYIPILLTLSFFYFSCKSKEESELSRAFDSLKTADVRDSLPGRDSASFENAVSSFSGKYNAVADWSVYGRQEKNAFRKAVLNKHLIVPVLAEKISIIRENGFSDTSLVYTGNKNNAFVFIVDKGGKNIDKLSGTKNGLLLLKATEISDSQKLYLVKKHTDFQHREMKVTEFTVTVELIDAVNTDVPAQVLGNRFAAVW